MTSLVDIGNQALSEAAARAAIQSLTEDSSEASAVNMNILPVRDQVMRAARWGMCRKTATLTMLKAAPGTPENTTSTDTVWTTAMPPPGWLYTYAYPSDCAFFWRIARQPSPTTTSGVPLFSVSLPGVAWPANLDMTYPARWEVASDEDDLGNVIKVILANETQALGIYSRTPDNVNLWDAQFVEAVVQGLAGKLAIAVSGNEQRARACYARANEAIKMARAQDGNEGYTNTTNDASWIMARTGLLTSGTPSLGWAPYGPLFSV